MLTFRNTNIVFICLLLLIAGLDISGHVPFFVYPALLLVYSLVLFYGCYSISSNFFLPVICSAVTSKKEIAISFDDGPASNFTPAILQVLKENDVEAAFFCIGKNIPGNESLFKQVHDAGHLIGNHSYSHHFWFDLFSSSKMLQDVRLMDHGMQEVLGLKPRLFRPPYGVINPNLKKAIINGGYSPVGWSVRSMDTVTTDEGKLIKKINNSLKPGAIFLFHDTSRITLSVLPAFLRYVKESGYQVTRLDKMLNLKPYA